MQVVRKNNLGRGWLWGWLEVIARANLRNCNWAVATMLYILLSQSKLKTLYMICYHIISYYVTVLDCLVYFG